MTKRQKDPTCGIFLERGLFNTAVKPLEYEDEYRALEQNLNLTM